MDMFGKTTGRTGLGSRQTIMMREQRKYLSPTNYTTADSQYEREQRKLEAKRRRRQDLSNSRRVAICGSKQERNEVKQEVKRRMDELVAIKNQKSIREKREDKEKMSSAVSREQAIFGREAQKKQEKREYLRRMMEENKRLVQMRNVKEQESKNRERERANKEVDFFDKYKSYL